MYIPSHFHIDEIKVAYDIIKEHSSATLFSQQNGVPFATHLPLILDKENTSLINWNRFRMETNKRLPHLPLQNFICLLYFKKKPANPYVCWFLVLQNFVVSKHLSDGRTVRAKVTIQ